VADRVDSSDAKDIGHDRVGGASPALGRDPPIAGEAHQVPADQEEFGQAGPFDDVELVSELANDRWSQRVVATPGARLAELDEVAEGRLTLGHVETGKPVALEPEIDRARRRQLPGDGQALRPGARGARLGTSERGVTRRQRRHVGRRLQVRLAVGPAQVGEGIERPAVEDRGHDVVQLTVLGPGVVDVVRDHARQSELLGERRRLGDQPVVVGQEVMRQLEEEATRRGAVAAPTVGAASAAVTGTSAAGPFTAAGSPTVAPVASDASPEQPRVSLGNCPRTGPIADPQPADNLAFAAAGQRDQALDVVGEERLGDPGNALGSGEVGPRNEPAQAAITGAVSSKQGEMRPALPLPHSTQVLLDRAAMAGEAGTSRTEPGGTTLPRDRHERRRIDRPEPHRLDA